MIASWMSSTRSSKCLDGRHRLVDGAFEQSVEQVVGPVPQPVPRVARNVRSLGIEDLQRLDVEGDQVIRPEEDVELVQHQGVGLGEDPRHPEDDIEIGPPVVDLGDVGLPQRILDGEGMEREDAVHPVLDRAGFGTLRRHQIRPEDPLGSLTDSAIRSTGQSTWMVPPPSR